ncbi:Ribonuclease VapC9 [Halomicronema hongdechloris C2206]|uniref:Ribonuclease VapC9 n=1 Tax=Halomicronema hongdechloris C2206 TaxID=1641165 RepID=A0A1Z3HNP3_9CYAN|nr:type II toxin-antitoxin system VapC family toxin [Halomicronema hongdechloris]ASC71900.1 Ribonuclease VapC9 [Halomicronema hongdechloris C2206]
MNSPVRCVVDASVAIKLFIEQEGSEQAEVLFAKLSTGPDTELYVPELFYAECANVLWQYVRRANYPATDAKASLVRLKALALQRVAIPELVNEALDIAIAHNISAYDACYVELSERLKVPLVTADSKLIRALEGTNYQVLSLTTFPPLNSNG